MIYTLDLYSKKVQKRYDLCMYLYSSNPNCFCNVSYNPERAVNAAGRTVFVFRIECMIGFLVTLPQKAMILMCVFALYSCITRAFMLNSENKKELVRC